MYVDDEYVYGKMFKAVVHANGSRYHTLRRCVVGGGGGVQPIQRTICKVYKLVELSENTTYVAVRYT